MNNYTSPENNTPATGVSVTPTGGQSVMVSNPYVMPAIPKKPKREYSAKENMFAWLCFVLAYLFTLTIPINSNPLGLFVVIMLMYIVSTIVLLTKGKKPPITPLVFGASAVIVSCSLILTANNFLHTFAYLYAMVVYCYYIYALSSDNNFKYADVILADFIKALFVLPFYSFESMFVSMFSGKQNKGGRLMVKVLCGVAIAIIPTVIIFALLSYDESFSVLMEKMFNFEDFDLFRYIVKLILAIPFGAYAYSIYISSVDKKCEHILSSDKRRTSITKIQFVPQITVLVAVLPILFLYIVFFVSQFKYYVSGFTSVLPQGFSYAQYAREGFFELCTVSVINLVIIISISLFIKRKKGKRSVLLKIISIILSVFTLVLISTALAKMSMYIDCYGLTPKRVYATWFMIVLALVFVLVIIRQFVPKLQIIVLSISLLVVMFALLSLSGVESYIAKYNVDRYLDKTLPTVDVAAIEDLGDAGVPELVRLAEVLDSNNDTDIATTKLDEIDNEMYYELVVYLRDKAAVIRNQDENGSRSIWSFTVPSAKAEKALRSTSLFE